MATPNTSPQGISDQDLKKVRQFIIDAILRDLENERPTLNERRGIIEKKLVDQLNRLPASVSDLTKQKIADEVRNEILGFGPIQKLLDDEDVSEVMVNGPDHVYVEKKGQLILSDVKFEDNAEILKVIDRIILPLGRRVDFDSPTVDARLPDGSRVNAVIPPVAIDGASITIRKFKKDKLTIKQLVGFGSLTDAMAEFLRACVISRLNVVVSGGTGSGKTTLLNVLSGFIPSDERICKCSRNTLFGLKPKHPTSMAVAR